MCAWCDGTRPFGTRNGRRSLDMIRETRFRTANAAKDFPSVSQPSCGVGISAHPGPALPTLVLSPPCWSRVVCRRRWQGDASSCCAVGGPMAGNANMPKTHRNPSSPHPRILESPPSWMPGCPGALELSRPGPGASRGVVPGSLVVEETAPQHGAASRHHPRRQS